MAEVRLIHAEQVSIKFHRFKITTIDTAEDRTTEVRHRLIKYSLKLSEYKNGRQRNFCNYHDLLKELQNYIGKLFLCPPQK